MKFNFARNKTAFAVAAALTVGAAAPAFAVSHSDTGLGDVGLIPYYTVRDGYDTNISVVNTSSRYVVAFKIHFREGSNSRDARDFNVFLSPNDVWTATITMGEDGETPLIRTVDSSCTAPWITDDPSRRDSAFVVVGQTPDGRLVKEMEMTKLGYAVGDDGQRSRLPPDSGSSSIARTQEGHIEIIEMGVADPNQSILASLAVHGSGHNCQALAEVYINRPITVTGSGSLQCNETDIPNGAEAVGNQAFEADFCEPLNLLKVSSDLINTQSGVGTGMPISMLSDFFNPLGIEDYSNPDQADLMEDPAGERPDLRNAFPALSVQIANGVPVPASFVLDSMDAVSSLFSATDIINEYGTGGGADAQTAWVITFPTKNYYVDDLVYPAPIIPFQELYRGRSCVTVDFDYYDREERHPVTELELFPSPEPIDPVPINTICDEAQVLNFGSKSIFSSQHNYIVPREEGFSSGWMRLGFPNAGEIVSGEGIRFLGLPTIGFSMKTLDNGVIGNQLRTYGIMSEHAYERVIIEPAAGN